MTWEVVVGASAWLKNSTGATIAKGKIVKASAAADDSIILTVAGDTVALGVVEQDIPAGLYGRVVLAGLAEVLIDNVGGCSRGDIISASTATAGECTAAATPGAQVVGSALRARGSAGLVWTEVRQALYSAPGVAAYDLSNYRHYDALIGQRYYLAGTPASSLDPDYSNYSLANDVILAAPFFVPTQLKAIKLAFHIDSTPGGGLAHIGVYSNKAQGYLYGDQLIVDGGEVDVSAGAGAKEVTISQLIGPGLVWVTILVKVTILLAAQLGTDCVPILGTPSTMTDAPGIGWTATQAYGALPATFPTAGAAIIPAASNLPVLAIGFGA